MHPEYSKTKNMIVAKQKLMALQNRNLWRCKTATSIIAKPKQA